MADRFPRGKLNADDEGAPRVRVGYRTVVLDFGKPVVWIGMDYHTAMELAANIIRRAQEIKPKEE